ncbi:MAG: hypothetical protein ACM3VW_06960, partial [Bacteroidota bacterium]
TGIFSPDDVRTSISLEASEHNALRSDVKVDLQYGKQRNRFWRIGVRDVGDAETLILQHSFASGKNGARVGIYGNKLGVGYDLAPQQRLGLEADLWDPEDLRLDLTGRYNLASHADVLFGFNQIGEGTDPFIGLRYKTDP